MNRYIYSFFRIHQRKNTERWCFSLALWLAKISCTLWVCEDIMPGTGSLRTRGLLGQKEKGRKVVTQAPSRGPGTGGASGAQASQHYKVFLEEEPRKDEWYFSQEG